MFCVLLTLLACWVAYVLWHRSPMDDLNVAIVDCIDTTRDTLAPLAPQVEHRPFTQMGQAKNNPPARSSQTPRQAQ